MIVCHPASSFGQRAWRSSSSSAEEHSVFPQEVGFYTDSDTDTATASAPLHEVGDGGGVLVVEFTARYHPASIDVYIGKPTSGQDEVGGGQMVGSPGSSSISSSSSSHGSISRSSSAAESLYASAVFTRLHSSPVHLALPPPCASTSASVTAGHAQQTRILLPQDISFSFIRLLVYPTVKDSNPGRVCDITAVTYRPLFPLLPLMLPAPDESSDFSSRGGNASSSSFSSSIDAYLERRRVKHPPLSSLSCNSDGKPTSHKHVSFSEIEKWKKKLLAIIPPHASPGASLQQDDHRERQKAFVHIHILEMNFIIAQITQLQEQLQTCLSTAAGQSGEAVAEREKGSSSNGGSSGALAGQSPSSPSPLQLQALVAAFNTRCAALVRRQRELLALPPAQRRGRGRGSGRGRFWEHFNTSRPGEEAVEEAGALEGCARRVRRVNRLDAAWTPQVLGAADVVQWVYVKGFWRARDVVYRHQRPSLLLPPPVSPVPRIAEQDKGQDKGRTGTGTGCTSEGLLHSKSELLTKHELVINSSDSTTSIPTPVSTPSSASASASASAWSGSSRLPFRGVVAGSLIAHCFCDTWLKHFVVVDGEKQQKYSPETQELPSSSSSSGGSSSKAVKWKKLKKSKILSCQIKLLENMTSAAAAAAHQCKHTESGSGVATNSLLLCSVVACHGLLRGSEALWLAALGLVTRLHTPSSPSSSSSCPPPLFSRRELQEVDYSVLVYVLSVTLPAVLIGRFAVLDKYNHDKKDEGEEEEDDDGGKEEMFKDFQSKSQEAVDELVLVLSLSSHVGRHLLAAFFCRVVHLCLDLLHQDTGQGQQQQQQEEQGQRLQGEGESCFQAFLVKIVHSFLELLRKLVIKFDFQKDTSLDRRVLQALAAKCLSLPPLRRHSSAACARMGSLHLFVHSSARGLDLLCKAHVLVEEKNRAEALAAEVAAAAKIQAKHALRRQQLQQVQQQLIVALARDAKRQLRADRRAARHARAEEARARRRAQRQARARTRREQRERQQHEAEEQLRGITEANRAAFVRKKEGLIEEMRSRKPKERNDEDEQEQEQKQKQKQKQGEQHQHQQQHADELSVGTSSSDFDSDLSEEEGGESEADSGGADESDSDKEQQQQQQQQQIYSPPSPAGAVMEAAAGLCVVARGHAALEVGVGGQGQQQQQEEQEQEQLRDIDRVEVDVGGRLFQHYILLQDSPADAPLIEREGETDQQQQQQQDEEEEEEDTVVLLLDHYLFLRPLQRLFASYSDFKLFFGVNNVLVDSAEEARGEQPMRRRGRRKNQPPVPLPPLGGATAMAMAVAGGEGDDSDIDIDAIVELTIQEFNKQETFQSETVEALTRKRTRRKSLQGDATTTATAIREDEDDEDEDQKEGAGGGEEDNVDDDDDDDGDGVVTGTSTEQEKEKEEKKARRRHYKSSFTDVVSFSPSHPSDKDQDRASDDVADNVSDDAHTKGEKKEEKEEGEKKEGLDEEEAVLRAEEDEEMR